MSVDCKIVSLYGDRFNCIMVQLYKSNYIRINNRIRVNIMILSIQSEISTLRSTSA